MREESHHLTERATFRTFRPARLSRQAPRDSERLARKEAVQYNSHMHVFMRRRDSAQKQRFTRVGAHLARRFGLIRAEVAQCRQRAL